MYGDAGALRAFERAETALEEANANEGHHLAAVALGEATADGNPVMIATAAVEKANAHLDTTRKTRAAIEEQLKVVENELQYAKGELDAAVRTVMRDEGSAIIDSILVEATALQEQLGAKRATLSFLKSACFSSHERELAKPIEDFLAAPTYPWEFNGRKNEHPALERWHAAREALRQDASAPLPI